MITVFNAKIPQETLQNKNKMPFMNPFKGIMT